MNVPNAKLCLKGRYGRTLAASKGASDGKGRKSLDAVLVVEADNAWHTEFAVTLGLATKTTTNLAVAVRAYEMGKWQ